MSHDPTPRDLELADRANLYGASDYSIIGDGTRTPAERHAVLRAAADAQLRAYHRAERSMAAAATAPWLYQAAPGMVIDDRRTGAPYWSEPGGFYVEGVYFGAIGAADRARRNALERAHRAALRENDYRARQAAEAEERWEATAAGRQALAAESNRAS